jgi:hypothetical protein
VCAQLRSEEYLDMEAVYLNTIESPEARRLNRCKFHIKLIHAERKRLEASTVYTIFSFFLKYDLPNFKVL